MSLDLPRAGGPVLDLLLERGPGGATRIARRRVAWPWSLPRGYALGGPEGCLTLVPQAAGAALMPGDVWEQRLTLGPGAAVRLVTAGATAVHGLGRAETSWRLSLGPGAWLAMLPDPAVLFEGAALSQTVEADLGAGAVLILADGVCLRGPGVRPLGWSSRLVATGPGGTILDERQEAGPESFPRLARLPHEPAAFGSLTAFGVSPTEPGPLDLPGCYAAAGILRGRAGITARVAAPDGGALSGALRRLAAAWAPGFEPRL